MLDFIYDSLDTVKKLKFPTAKQFAELTAAIFGLVIIAWLFFIVCDTFFSEGYRVFYEKMTNTETTNTAVVATEDNQVNNDVIEIENVGEAPLVEGLAVNEQSPIELATE